MVERVQSASEVNKHLIRTNYYTYLNIELDICTASVQFKRNMSVLQTLAV